MADILKISDATALALHSLTHLALDPGSCATTAEIAKVFDASQNHLSKVHQRLVKAGLIRSRRGPSGGVSLAKDPETITLMDIYEVMEGPMTQDPCLFGKDACPRESCMLHSLLPTLVAQVRDYFENTTLAQMATQSNWREGK